MSDRITRRTFLRRAAASGSILTVPGLLAACGGSGGAGTTSHQLAKTLHFSNWTYYIDVNKKEHTNPSLVAFQKKYSVHVDYVEDINDNASFFGKIQGPLSRGQSVDRDIVVPRVALVEIDVIELEPAERVVDLLQHLLAREAAVAVRHLAVELRRDDVGVSRAPRERAAEHLF